MSLTRLLELQEAALDVVDWSAKSTPHEAERFADAMARLRTVLKEQSAEDALAAVDALYQAAKDVVDDNPVVLERSCFAALAAAVRRIEGKQ